MYASGENNSAPSRGPGDTRNRHGLSKTDARTKPSHVLLRQVDDGSAEMQQVLKCMEKHYIHPWKTPEWIPVVVEIVKNPHLEKRFQQKKREMLIEGRTSKETKESYAFNVEKAGVIHEICSQGLQCRDTGRHTLGHDRYGVTVFRHADVSLAYGSRMKYSSPLTVIMYKILIGNSKSVRLRSVPKAPILDPTPGHDSHVPVQKPLPAVSMKQNALRSQIYLYECNDKGVYSLTPRHVLPWAVITFINQPPVPKTVCAEPTRIPEESPQPFQTTPRKRTVDSSMNDESPLKRIKIQEMSPVKSAEVSNTGSTFIQKHASPPSALGKARSSPHCEKTRSPLVEIPSKYALSSLVSAEQNKQCTVKVVPKSALTEKDENATVPTKRIGPSRRQPLMSLSERFQMFEKQRNMELKRVDGLDQKRHCFSDECFDLRGNDLYDSSDNSESEFSHQSALPVCSASVHQVVGGSRGTFPKLVITLTTTPPATPPKNEQVPQNASLCKDNEQRECMNQENISVECSSSKAVEHFSHHKEPSSDVKRGHFETYGSSEYVNNKELTTCAPRNSELTVPEPIDQSSLGGEKCSQNNADISTRQFVLLDGLVTVVKQTEGGATNASYNAVSPQKPPLLKSTVTRSGDLTDNNNGSELSGPVCNGDIDHARTDSSSEKDETGRIKDSSIIEMNKDIDSCPYGKEKTVCFQSDSDLRESSVQCRSENVKDYKKSVHNETVVCHAAAESVHETTNDCESEDPFYLGDHDYDNCNSEVQLNSSHNETNKSSPVEETDSDAEIDVGGTTPVKVDTSTVDIEIIPDKTDSDTDAEMEDAPNGSVPVVVHTPNTAVVTVDTVSEGDYIQCNSEQAFADVVEDAIENTGSEVCDDTLNVSTCDSSKRNMDQSTLKPEISSFEAKDTFAQIVDGSTTRDSDEHVLVELDNNNEDRNIMSEDSVEAEKERVDPVVVLQAEGSKNVSVHANTEICHSDTAYTHKDEVYTAADTGEENTGNHGETVRTMNHPGVVSSEKFTSAVEREEVISDENVTYRDATSETEENVAQTGACGFDHSQISGKSGIGFYREVDSEMNVGSDFNNDSAAAENMTDPEVSSSDPLATVVSEETNMAMIRLLLFKKVSAPKEQAEAIQRTVDLLLSETQNMMAFRELKPQTQDDAEKESEMEVSVPDCQTERESTETKMGPHTPTKQLCPTETKIGPHTPTKQLCPTETNMSSYMPSKQLFPTETKMGWYTPSKQLCPIETKTELYTPSKELCPTETKMASFMPSEQLCPTEIKMALFTPSKQLCPTETKMASSTPSKQLCPTETKMVSSTPSKQLCPTETRMASSTPSKQLCPTETKMVSYTPSKELCPTENKIGPHTPSRQSYPSEAKIESYTPSKHMYPLESKMAFYTPSKPITKEHYASSHSVPTNKNASSASFSKQEGESRTGYSQKKTHADSMQSTSFKLTPFSKRLSKMVSHDRHWNSRDVCTKQNLNAEPLKKPEGNWHSSDTINNCDNSTKGSFHGRTLLRGKSVPPRKIPHEPLYKFCPVKPSGKPEVIPEDPRPAFYARKAVEEMKKAELELEKKEKSNSDDKLKQSPSALCDTQLHAEKQAEDKMSILEELNKSLHEPTDSVQTETVYAKRMHRRLLSAESAVTPPHDIKITVPVQDIPLPVPKNTNFNRKNEKSNDHPLTAQIDPVSSSSERNKICNNDSQTANSSQSVPVQDQEPLSFDECFLTNAKTTKAAYNLLDVGSEDEFAYSLLEDLGKSGASISPANQGDPLGAATLPSVNEVDKPGATMSPVNQGEKLEDATSPVNQGYKPGGAILPVVNQGDQLRGATSPVVDQPEMECFNSRWKDNQDNTISEGVNENMEDSELCTRKTVAEDDQCIRKVETSVEDIGLGNECRDFKDSSHPVAFVTGKVDVQKEEIKRSPKESSLEEVILQQIRCLRYGIDVNREMSMNLLLLPPPPPPPPPPPSMPDSTTLEHLSVIPDSTSKGYSPEVIQLEGLKDDFSMVDMDVEDENIRGNFGGKKILGGEVTSDPKIEKEKVSIGDSDDGDDCKGDEYTSDEDSDRYSNISDENLEDFESDIGTPVRDENDVEVMTVLSDHSKQALDIPTSQIPCYSVSPLTCSVSDKDVTSSSSFLNEKRHSIQSCKGIMKIGEKLCPSKVICSRSPFLESSSVVSSSSSPQSVIFVDEDESHGPKFTKQIQKKVKSVIRPQPRYKTLSTEFEFSMNKALCSNVTSDSRSFESESRCERRRHFSEVSDCKSRSLRRSHHRSRERSFSRSKSRPRKSITPKRSLLFHQRSRSRSKSIQRRPKRSESPRFRSVNRRRSRSCSSSRRSRSRTRSSRSHRAPDFRSGYIHRRSRSRSRSFSRSPSCRRSRSRSSDSRSVQYQRSRSRLGSRSRSSYRRSRSPHMYHSRNTRSHHHRKGHTHHRSRTRTRSRSHSRSASRQRRSPSRSSSRCSFTELIEIQYPHMRDIERKHYHTKKGLATSEELAESMLSSARKQETFPRFLSNSCSSRFDNFHQDSQYRQFASDYNIPQISQGANRMEGSAVSVPSYYRDLDDFSTKSSHIAKMEPYDRFFLETKRLAKYDKIPGMPTHNYQEDDHFDRLLF